MRFERRGVRFVRLESVGFGRVERVERGASFGWLVNAPITRFSWLYYIKIARRDLCHASRGTGRVYFGIIEP